MGLHFVLSPGTYSSVISFCLIFCDYYSVSKFLWWWFPFCRLCGYCFSCFGCLYPPDLWVCLRGLCRLPAGKSLPTASWSWVLSLWSTRPWWACPEVMVSEEFKHPVWELFCLLLVVGLRPPYSTGAYRLLLGPNLGRKWQSPAGLTPMHTSQNCYQQCLWPCNAPQRPPVSAGDPPILSDSLVQSLMRSLLLTLGLGKHKTCGIPVIKLLAFKPDSLSSSLHCQTPRLVSLTWGLEHVLLWENFWGIIIF